MRKITFLLRPLTFLSALVGSGRAASLATDLTGPNGDTWSDGDKFSILTGDTPVTIHSFDIHMANVTVDVQIWITEGFFDWMFDYATHTKVYTAAAVTGLGQGFATPLPAFSPPIEIAANSNVGFYVTLNDKGGRHMYHSDGLSQNTVFATDGTISITEGLSQKHFMAQFDRPTRWNGVAHYSIPTGSPTSAPTFTMAPSSTLSAAPTLTPSDKPSMPPSDQPSSQSGSDHSSSPSHLPSSTPSQLPSLTPSLTPSETPSRVPSTTPSDLPSQAPSRRPTLVPTTAPSLHPHSAPGVATATPQSVASAIPSLNPSASPSERPWDSSEAPGHAPSSLRLAAVLVPAAAMISYFL